MRRLLPQTLPAWVLLIVIAGLLASQVTTLYIVARDRAASSDIVDYYRLNDRAFSIVQLMYSASPEERRRLASGVTSSSYAMTVSDTPAVTSAIAQDDQLAELEDILVGRLSKFGITEARAGLLPGGKLDLLDGLARKGRKVLMVGDGLNDAPALAASHVSISPVSASHLAQSAADIVFLGDSLAPVVQAVAIGRKARRLMIQNLWLAVLYNAIAVPVAIAGLVTPLIAAAAMSGSSLVVTLNALRARSAGGGNAP